MYVWQSLKTKMITGCWFHVQWRDGTYLHHSSLRHDRNTDSSKNSGQRKTGNNGWSTGHKIARFAKLFHKSFKIGKKTFYSTFKEGQRHPPSWEARVSRQQSKSEMEEVPWKTEPEKKNIHICLSQLWLTNLLQIWIPTNVHKDRRRRGFLFKSSSEIGRMELKKINKEKIHTHTHTSKEFFQK